MRRGERPRALFLGYRAPGRDAGSARIADLLGLMAADGWRPAFATAEPLVDPREARELRQSGVPVYDGTTSELETLVAEGGFRVAICASWQVGELYLASIRRLSPETAVLIDAPSLQLVRGARASLRSARRSGRAPRLGAEYGSELTGELNVYASSDAVLTASALDAELLNNLLGDDRLAYWVPDAGEVPSRTIPFAERRGIVLPAIPDDPAYADAVGFLRSSIEPRLGRELLDQHPISVADGLLSVLERALLTIVPLRSDPLSSRVQIQSLLAGTPVVTTSAGQRGLEVTAGAGVLVADDEALLAESVERLATDKELWLRLAKRGRARVRRFHAREAVTSRLLEAVALAQDRQGRRPQPVEGDRARFDLRVRRRRTRELVPAIRGVVRATVPADSHIAVLSDGVDELLGLDVATVTHFPRTGLDEAAARPSDSGEAIALLEREIRDGADTLLVPSTAFAWLDAYPEFKDYLRDRFSVHEEESCIVVDLRRAGVGSSALRLVAFFLPQFHPIPENDEWWGPGFTEWSNVARAGPLFPGHDQPRVPGELGFYDLRLAETREAQARLAAEAGIEAFCYYHYWFQGKRLLEAPFEEVLESGRPDFPFCLCWANEPWSRRWDGSDDAVLQPQSYSPEDDLEHIRWLMPALSDERALTVGGKPVFLVYHARALPDPARTADLWRREVRKAGLRGLHLVAVETSRDAGRKAMLGGFDATVRFQPQFTALLGLDTLDVGAPEGLRVWDYEQAWRRASRADPPGYRRYESVFPGWDNTPRRGEHGWVLHNATSESYGRWLTQVAEEALGQPPEHRLVFLNAWNEWAEGAYLEPDRRHGRAYLEQTRAVVDALSRRRPAELRDAEPSDVESEPHGRQPVVVREPGEELLGEEAHARAVAFYLPQFHPTPENDEWWGPGFTEWTNVVEAKPLFPGHYQPHVPSHVGFYDLRVPEVREAQAELARNHGVEAFCYWHYWFSGRRLLGRPFDETLSSGRPDFPFCLAWANESWSRRWLGEPRDLLIEQRYSARDDVAHARWLLEAFADPRYLRVLGRPVFVVYRPKWLEDPPRTAEIIRQECVNAGLPEPILLGTTSWDGADCRDLGFDGTIEFEPRLSALGDPTGDTLNVHDYADARASMRVVRDFPVYPSIVVSWDNTPRRGDRGTVFTDATPERFEQGLRELVESVRERPFPHRLVFLNAWNEWAEGNHLEPDLRYGLGHLEAVRRVFFEHASPEPSLTTVGAHRDT
jgi:lipopolysaccharide biosynthesis protein/glycosyltransferase involved in cell wall biosynthesis